VVTLQPNLKVLCSGVGMVIALLFFLALWLFFYASGFSILQNIGVFVLSVAITFALMALLFLPFAASRGYKGE